MAITRALSIMVSVAEFERKKMKERQIEGIKIEQPHLSGPICKLVHDWLLVHGHDGLWRRWAVTQCTVWSFGVVMVPPSFNDDLGFTQGIEDFAVQQFIPHSPVEAFAVPVLPG